MTTLAIQPSLLNRMEAQTASKQTRRRRGWLSKDILSLHECLLARPTLALARRLEQSQYWPRERIEALQIAKLRRLLDHAARHCPYYRTMGLPPARDLRTLDDLASIPLLTRRSLRANAASMRWHAARERILTGHTHGTADEPFPFYWERRRQAWDKAHRIRAHRWHGFDLTDRELHYWPLDPPRHRSERIRHLLRRLRDALVRDIQIDSLTAAGQNLAKSWQAWRRFDPLRVTALPSALADFILAGRRAGCRMGNPALRRVFLTGEVVFDWQRSLIERHLQAGVVQCYGLQEVGPVAFECSSGHLHACGESVIIEIIRRGRPAAPGELGEVVVTGLESRAMPIIRYATGDIARAAAPIECPCGRRLQILPPILGRAGDFLEADAGTWITPAQVVASLGGLLQDGRFLVLQQAAGGLEIQLAFNGGRLADLRERSIQRLAELLGGPVDCAVHRVTSLVRAGSGKCRYVASERTRRGLAELDHSAACLAWPSTSQVRRPRTSRLLR